jgi:hypothetical protein
VIERGPEELTRNDCLDGGLTEEAVSTLQASSIYRSQWGSADVVSVTDIYIDDEQVSINIGCRWHQRRIETELNECVVGLGRTSS